MTPTVSLSLLLDHRMHGGPLLRQPAPRDAALQGPAHHFQFMSEPPAAEEEDRLASRWRHVILELAADFVEVSDLRNDLSPILMNALLHVMEQLLLFGDEEDLTAIEEWLDTEER